MRRAALAIPAVLIALFVAAPMFIVVPMSFSTAISFEFPPPGYSLHYYARFFSDRSWTVPAINSLIIATGTSIVTMLIVTPAAFVMVRQRFIGKTAVNVLMLLPMMVPAIVMSLAYYSYFGELKLLQTFPGVIIAHSCMATPVAFLIVQASLKGFDRNLERAAMNLGAGPLRSFTRVTFPVLRPGFLVAALFAFIQSFDEAVVAIFISGRDTITLPRKMFESIRMDADPVIAVVSTLIFSAILGGTLIGFALRRRPQTRPA
jgi:putative spermidine/putrescine transport system permease protein